MAEDRQGGKETEAHDERKVISGERARQGFIVLNSPARRRIFIAGLVGAVLLMVVIGLAA